MSIPFIASPNKNSGRRKKIRLVVMHTMEAPERGTTAEDVARNWFAKSAAKSSAHYCIDNNSVVQCVREADTAWHAPNANADGIGIEQAGYASQTATQWDDSYSVAMIDIAAKLLADICTRNNIPIVKLTPAQVVQGARGVCGHWDISKAYNPGGHTDPGPNYPWDTLITKARKYAGQNVITPVTNADVAKKSVVTEFPLTAGQWYGVDDHTVFSHSGARAADRANIRNIQSKVGTTADGFFGKATAAKVSSWQRVHKLLVDGRVGPMTWKGLGL